jgi:hypothetical protein
MPMPKGEEFLTAGPPEVDPWLLTDSDIYTLDSRACESSGKSRQKTSEV